MNQNPPGKSVDKPIRLLVETGEGRSASALLENDFLRYCLALGAEVHVLSPGACFEPFVERYQLPGTRFYYLSVKQAWKIRHRRVIKYGNRLENRLQILLFSFLQLTSARYP